MVAASSYPGTVFAQITCGVTLKLVLFEKTENLTQPATSDENKSVLKVASGRSSTSPLGNREDILLKETSDFSARMRRSCPRDYLTLYFQLSTTKTSNIQNISF